MEDDGRADLGTAILDERNYNKYLLMCLYFLVIEGMKRSMW